MFGIPISRDHGDTARLVGVYDPNPKRARIFSERCGGTPAFDGFDAMLDAARPDAVIVATIDARHHEYVVRALAKGCDVVCEKPLTTDLAKGRAILAERDRTGRDVAVTFNMRFMPYMARVKQLLAAGAIGEVTAVRLEWLLDRSHGADYFRRWHRYRRNSGGLQIHKASHHFDVVDWWLDDAPVRVYATGALRFYGANGPFRSERCTGCPHAARCAFYWDLDASPFDRALYRETEDADGYFRDRCVFAEDIDIEDTLAAQVSYARGATLSYTLCAYAPYEGFRATIDGREGRIECGEFYSGPRAAEPDGVIEVFAPDGARTVHRVPKHGVVHGGGDERLRAMLFGTGPFDDPLGRKADLLDGLRSLSVGDGINRSLRTGRPVRLTDAWDIIEE